MGQGFSLATPPAGMAGIDVPELADLVYEQSLGAARFMKTVRARHHDGVVLVKVLTKPYPMSLDKYKQDILRERQILAGVRNALPYQRAIETETNGYLVRQFMYNSLYDRLSTRPFLEDIEKKWLAFQLLCALRDCHARNVYHGDIKTENTMVTSWNWLYLSDFSSSFKRVMLPEDNPADFSYFFDTSLRRTCYLAPERFLPPGQLADPDACVTWAMDIFSAGCVVAELFLEAPAFTLAQLFKYRRGEYNPVISHLSRIPDKDLRDMIAHMIQLEPDKRSAAREYLDFYKGKVFPAYFYTFLHEYMGDITDGLTHSPSTGVARHFGEADQRIENVWQDFDKISACLGHQQPQHNEQVVFAPAPRLGLGHFPVRLHIPHNDHFVRVARQPAADDGTLIFLTLVSSSLRNTAHAAAKIKACDVLLAFAERLTDEARLDRVLPYLMVLVHDKYDMVVISALRTIAQLLDLVTVLNPVNSQIFLEYILPRYHFALLSPNSHATPIVRATYASSLGKLATTAARYLAMAATLRADGSVTTADPEVEPGNEAEAAFDGMFDSARRDLTTLFESHTKVLIEDPDPFVRRAFLTSVPDLCVFFGAAQANDIILTHLNTYLNDRDWMLKCAFFDTIVGISTFLGSSTLEKFILPLMIQAVADPEEYVVQGALHSLAELANLGLLSKPTFLELVGVIARFTMHPNIWVRESAAEFVAAGRTFQNPAFLRTLLFPLVKPYLKPHRIPDFSELALLDELRKPLSRTVFDQALLWASKTDKSNFWKPFRKLRDLTIGASASAGYVAGGEAKALSLSKVTKNEEDEQWLSKLRNLGLTAEDEAKLLALREFIWRLSQIKSRDSNVEAPNTALLDQIISVKNLGIRILTVFFDEEPVRPSTAVSGLPDIGAPRTIKDALFDASMTIDDPVGKRRRAAQNNYRSRFSSRDARSPRSPDGRRRTLGEGDVSPPSGGEGARQVLGSHGNGSGGRTPSEDGSVLLGVPDTPLSDERSLRHRSSAMSLMNRKDSAKTMPETSTTEANASGEVEGPFVPPAAAHRRTLAGTETSRESQHLIAGPPLRASHTYAGNDPSILRMLDSMSVDNFPHDMHEFGPVVTPVHRRRQASSSHPASGLVQGKRDGWRPRGKLVATFAEHHGAINRVVVSPDHTFFLTGGDDGCAKVWDTMRLEKNITHKSRQTHRHAAGARVMALCFIENTRCFVSCATDGSVHVVKVESSAPFSGGGGVGGLGSGVGIGNTSSGLPRYNKLRLLREHRLDEGEWAVWCEHFKHEGLGSVLVLATNRSVVLGIDLRTMELAFRLENPVHHGTPTCFAVDRKRNWLVLGTSHGVLDLWDLRFKVRLRGWGVPGKGAIYRLCICPTRSRGKRVCVAGGTGQGEVTVWDLEKKACREIYRVGGSKEGPNGYEAWEVDDDGPGGMLGRFGAAEIEPSGTSNADRGVRAIVVGISPSASDGRFYDGGGGGHDQVVSDAANNQWHDVRNAFLITAGSDKKLRFWDLARVENSVVFSGLQADEARPTFSSSHPLPNLTLNVERAARQSNSSSGGAADGGGGAAAHASGRKDRKAGGGSSSGGNNGNSTNNRPPRSTVISLQQQLLLRSHLDAVVDVTVLELPYMMTVSADRSGVVFVFQ